MSDLDEDFADKISKELDRVRTSIASQSSKMQSIIDKTSSMLLQSTLQADSDNTYTSKTTICKSDSNHSEIPIKYDFNRATVQNLIKIVENYKKITNLQKLLSQNPDHLIPVTTRSEEFENFRLNISNKHEFFKNAVRKLQFLLEKTKSMKDESEAFSESESSSDDDTIENESPNSFSFDVIGMSYRE